MLTTFSATLSPMLMLFFFMAVGFVARKTKILPENAGKVMAQMETWIFCPALSFITMAKFFTPESIKTHATNLLFSSVCVALTIGIAIFLARFFVKDKNDPERGIYKYALAFANGSYVGDPIVLALFGEVALSYYKLFYMPFCLLIYVWGIGVLVPRGDGKQNPLMRILNAPTVALFLGILFGLTGLGRFIPSFLDTALCSLRDCMGPVAMLLAGFTVAGYSIRGMLKEKPVYVATLLRLFVLPVVLLAAMFGVKLFLSSVLHLAVEDFVLYLAFFATAGPLGLNTIIFPEAYGGSPKTGAAMALISHTLCVVSIPLMYALMVAVFGPVTF